jgi:hypothetical protein
MHSIESPVRKNSGGRPPKFSEPSRPVTVTLPERTLAKLARIDSDRAQAIVKLADTVSAGKLTRAPQVEVVQMAGKSGLIVVGPSRALRSIPFLHLVEVAPERFLIALDPGNDFKTLEIAIHDAMEEVPEDEVGEKELITLLLGVIRRLRKAERVTMAEILLVNLEQQ